MSNTANESPMDAVPSKRLPSVRLDAGFHLARIIDMTPAEAGVYFRRLLVAINTGRRGLMAEADGMMAEAQDYYDKKRNAGRIGGLTTQGKRSSDAQSDASSHTLTHSIIHPSAHPETQEPEQPEDPLDVSGSLESRVAGLADGKLALFAATLFKEKDQVNAYIGAVCVLGDEAFRAELVAFGIELEDKGEQPAHFGETFRARLHDSMLAVAAQEATGDTDAEGEEAGAAQGIVAAKDTTPR